jgi:hypothetical protein
MDFNPETVPPDLEEPRNTTSLGAILDLMPAILASALLSPVMLMVAIAIYDTGNEGGA